MKKSALLFIVSSFCSYTQAHLAYFNPYEPNCDPTPEPYCECGYLSKLGPNPIIVLAYQEPFNRSNLIAIDSLEKELRSRAQERKDLENQALDALHEENLQKSQGPKPGVTTESPLPVIVTNPSYGPLTNAPASDVNNHIIELEKLNPDGTTDTHIFPFNYPYDQRSTVTIPSKSLYEKR